VLATLRKEGGGCKVGLVDTFDLLIKTLIPPDTIDGETEEHERLREETGVRLEETEQTAWSGESDSGY